LRIRWTVAVSAQHPASGTTDQLLASGRTWQTGRL
jgi:hypothetical protein